MVLHDRDLVEIKIIRVSLADACVFLFNSLMCKGICIRMYCRILYVPTYSLHKISKCEICMYFSAAVLFWSSFTDDIILYFQYIQFVDAMSG